jgi:hypothetical protein
MPDSAAAVATPAGATSPSYVVQGTTVTLPVEVRDATSMSAMFVVPTSMVRRLVPTPKVQIPELFPGRTLCVLAAIEYRDNDLGQYNEVSVAFFVQPGVQKPTPLFGMLNGFRRGRIGAYIHRLPVTTTFSRDAGRDIWGFPKTVDAIEFQDDGDRRTCRWVADGTHVLTLSAVRGGKRRMALTPQDAYACQGGVLYKTPSVMGGEGVGIRLGGTSVTLGAHPIADELRLLGFPRPALMSTWMDRMRARFDGPQIL